MKKVISKKITEKGSLEYLKEKVRNCYIKKLDIFKFKTVPTLNMNVKKYISRGVEDYESEKLKIEKVEILDAIVWPTQEIKPDVIRLSGLGNSEYGKSIITEDTNTKDNQLFKDIQKYKHGDIIVNIEEDDGGFYQVVSDRKGIKMIVDLDYTGPYARDGNLLPIGDTTTEDFDPKPILVKKFLEKIVIPKPYNLYNEDSVQSPYGLKFFLKGEKWPTFFGNTTKPVYRLLNIFDLENPILNKYLEHIQYIDQADHPEEFIIKDKKIEKEIDRTIKEFFNILKRYYSHCYIYLDTQEEQFYTTLNKIYTTIYDPEHKYFYVSALLAPLKTIEITINKELINELKSMVEVFKKQKEGAAEIKRRFNIPKEIDFSSYFSPFGNLNGKQFPYFK